MGRKFLTYEYVYNYFKEQGCELLEKEYINSQTRMNYKCNCNNKTSISFSKFKSGQRCKECGFKKLGNYCKLSYEYILNQFKKNDYELLETKYINNQTNMKYRCNNNHESYIKYADFQQGKRCKKCFLENNFGENHCNWIDDRNKLNSIKRIRRSFSRKWALKNMTQDKNYKDFCLNPENYNTDHIIPIAVFRDLMFEFQIEENIIRDVANNKDNLQLITIEDNYKKAYKADMITTLKYLIKHNIQFNKGF